MKSLVRWDDPPGRRAQVRAELDAYYARLYGLTRDELRYILDPKEVHGEDPSTGSPCGDSPALACGASVAGQVSLAKPSAC